MAGNEIKLSIKVDDNGSLSIVGREAEAASGKLDDVTDATDRTSKGQRNLDRNLKGTAKMTANSTKEFSKMSQGMTGGLVPAYAILASNVFALTAAFNFLKIASDVKNLEESQIAFAQNTGVALGSITQRLREASDGMLGFKEAGQAAAIGLAKGFSPSQLEALAEGARKASTALGRDFEDSFDRLVRGASKAEPELLDELGITLRLEEATQKYAEAIGKNRNELNTFQRSQAVLIETQRQLNENFGDVEAATNPFIKLSKTLEDIIKQATNFLLPVFEGLANILNRSAGAAIAAFGLLALSIFKTILPMEEIDQKFDEIGRNAQDKLDAATDAVEEFDKALEDSKYSLKELQDQGKKGFAETAQKEYKGSKSKVIQRGMSGEMTPQDKANFKKSVKSAEKQWRDHGKIVTGIHKGKNIEIVRDLDRSFGKMNTSAKDFQGKELTRWKRWELTVKKSFAKVSSLGTRTFLGLAKVAKGAGLVMDKAFKFAGFIGTFVLIKDLVMGLIEAPFTMVMAFAKGFDMLISIVAKTINFAGWMFLKLGDIIINMLGMVFGDEFGKIANKFLQLIQDIIESTLNLWLKGINNITSWVNKILPEDKQIKKIEDFDLGKVTLFNESASTTGDISNMADEFEGLATNATLAQDALEWTGVGGWLQGIESKNDRIKESTEALEAFRTANDKMSDSLGQTLSTMAGEEDLLKKQKLGWNALFSLDIAGQYEKINAKTSKFVKQQDGSMKRVTRYVMSDKDRAAALQDLKVKMGDIAKISPKFGAALASATLEGDAGLGKLAIQIRNAETQVKFFNSEIGNLSANIYSSLGSGDILGAIRSIKELETAALEGGGAIERLGVGGAKLADMLEQLKTAMGDEYDTNKVLRRLEQEHELKIRIAEDQKIIGALSSEYRDILESNLELTRIQSELEFTRYQLSLKLNTEQQIANELKARELELAIKLAEIERDKVLGAKVGQITGSKTLGGAAGPTADRELLQLRKEGHEADYIKAVTTEWDPAKAQAALDQIKAINKEMEFMAKMEFGNTLKALGEDFKALGPEGEYMGGMLTGLSTMTQSWTVGMEQIKNASGDMSKTVQGALTIAGGMISGLMQMQKAATKHKVKAIDDEIAAEKKRDGKSAGSLAKIKALEKKKEAIQKKAFEQEKKMKIAMTIINTMSAAMKAYESLASIPYVGPALGAAAAAMVAAFGMKQVAMIQATQFQGGGSIDQSTPGSASVGKRRSTIDVAKSQSAAGELAYLRGASGTGGPENFRGAFYGIKHRAEGGPTGYVVGEQGPELFVPQQPGTIVPNDDVAAMGGSNVTFNINTIDAVGVEDVLTQQQGNIIGMIRSAANEYGDPFLENVDTSIYNEPFAGYRRA